MNPVLVEALRGNAVESAHRGAFAVVDADGRIVLALGDIDRPVFPRSAVKLLQALPLVASGAAEALQLTDEELALACASHNGEPAHVATAAGMLAKAGGDAQLLECGAHWPYREAFQRELALRGEAPSALHNNCSGKHAGFVCLACRRAGGRPLRDFARGYVQPRASGDARGGRRAAGGHRLGPGATPAGHRRLLDPDLRASRCATWRWPSRAWPPARACRPSMRAPRGGCARRWRRRRSWSAAPTASTPA